MSWCGHPQFERQSRWIPSVNGKPAALAEHCRCGCWRFINDEANWQLGPIPYAYDSPDGAKQRKQNDQIAKLTEDVAKLTKKVAELETAAKAQVYEAKPKVATTATICHDLSLQLMKDTAQFKKGAVAKIVHVDSRNKRFDILMGNKYFFLLEEDLADFTTWNGQALSF